MNFYLIPVVFFGLLILISAFFIVKQQTAAVIERFGKFHSIRHSGLHLKIPLVDRIAGKLSLKIQQLDVIVETKTLDDVFVRLKVSVQYVVIKNKVYDAFYKLDYPHDQITSYVFDVVRVEVPKMKLDDVFVFILFLYVRRVTNNSIVLLNTENKITTQLIMALYSRNKTASA